MSDLSTLQSDIAALLSAHSFFTPGGDELPVTVLAEDAGDIENAIQQALLGLGIFVLVRTPIGRNANRNGSPARMRADVVLTVIENVTLNRSAAGTNVRSYRAANAIVGLLHLSSAVGPMMIWRGTQESRDYPPPAVDVRFEAPNQFLPVPERAHSIAGLEDGAVAGTGDLSTLQAEIAAYLGGHPFFADAAAGAEALPVPVLSADAGDIENSIQQALLGLGIFVLVRTPVGRNENENSFPAIMRPEVVLDVIENVTLNRGAAGTGIRAPRVANACAYLLHLHPLIGPLMVWTETIESKLYAAPALEVRLEAPFVELGEIVRTELDRWVTEDGDQVVTEEGEPIKV